MALGRMAALCYAAQLEAVFGNMENDLEQALAAVETCGGSEVVVYAVHSLLGRLL